jgi:hypothetical protein
VLEARAWQPRLARRRRAELLPTSPARATSIYEEPFTFARADYPAIDAWLTRIAATPGWKHPYDLMQRAFPA